MVPQLATVAHRYGMDVSGGGGFDSTSRKHDLAFRLADIERPVRLLHISDLDPSSDAIKNSLHEDVEAFLQHYRGGNYEMVRIAITPDQVDEYNLPTAPRNYDDNRGAFDEDWTVQAEALDPADLAEIVRVGIEANIDMRIWADAIKDEKKMRRSLVSRIGKAFPKPKPRKKKPKK